MVACCEIIDDPSDLLWGGFWIKGYILLSKWKVQPLQKFYVVKLLYNSYILCVLANQAGLNDRKQQKFTNLIYY
jgi:hypothetical protein